MWGNFYRNSLLYSTVLLCGVWSAQQAHGVESAAAATVPYQLHITKDSFGGVWCSGMTPQRGGFKKFCSNSTLIYNKNIPDAQWKRAAHNLQRIVGMAHSGALSLVDRYVTGNVLLKDTAQRDRMLNVLNTLPAGYGHAVRLYTPDLLSNYFQQNTGDSTHVCANAWRSVLKYSVVSDYTLKKCTHYMVWLQTPMPKKAHALIKKAHAMGIATGIVQVTQGAHVYVSVY